MDHVTTAYVFACSRCKRTAAETFDNRRRRVDFLQQSPKETNLDREERNKLNGVLNQVHSLAKFCSPFRGIVEEFCFFQLFPIDRAIDSKKYRAQLEKLREAVATKRPGLANRENVISRHDNAGPRVARNVQKEKNYVNLIGEILSHPRHVLRILPPQVITYFDSYATF